MRTHHRLLLEAEEAGPVPDIAETIAGLGVCEVKLGVGVGGVFHIVRSVIVDDTAPEDFAAACRGDRCADAGKKQGESGGVNKNGEQGREQAGHFLELVRIGIVIV